MIKKILIANRGEIARRIVRTCRQMGIRTVAVYSDPDRKHRFSLEADEAVALGGASPAQSYLRIDAILDAAAKTHADAIHPGYGFLAENAEFARACVGRGIKLIGPSAEAIAAMGSKIEAKRRMKEAGVPVLPSLEVTQQSTAELNKQLADWPWPILIKASAGGGGRGMRIVRAPHELAAALDAARHESKAAFGDDTVFIEPYVVDSRHIEMQIVGDSQGNVIHLFERECSIQRRHQKIIEEAPSVAIDEALRVEMGQASVLAGKAIHYESAGTVEFLFTPDGKFYFLEVNTRLQVEHPVTECITGLDLVRLQIEIAQGEPLPLAARSAQINGHAIEVRLYAEDPRHDYRPATGTIHLFEIPNLEGVRIETGIESGSQVSSYYDPMLAKIIVHAASRREAAQRLAWVLREARIHGTQTNRELLIRILEHPEFLAGQTDTHFLERHSPVELGQPLADQAAVRLHAAAAAFALQAQRRAAAPLLNQLPSGWRNSPSQMQETRFEFDDRTVAVKYRFHRDGVFVNVDGEDIALQLESCSPQQATLCVDGVRRTFKVYAVDERVFVDSILGSTDLRVLPRFSLSEESAAAGSLAAPMPGVVHEVRVSAGDLVEAGQTLLVIESMKMMYPINAPLGGRVAELRVLASQHVEAGAILAVIEPDPAP